MDNKTKPAPGLLLAQLVLSAVLLLVVGHATYEKDYELPTYSFQVKGEDAIFHPEGKRSVKINEIRTCYSVLLLLASSSAYFFVNLLFYTTIKIIEESFLYETVLILLQDVVFCVLMCICSLATVSKRGERAIGGRDTELLIASGISMFCAVSSGVGVYYSYRVYKGL